MVSESAISFGCAGAISATPTVQAAMARYATPPATERSGIFDSPSPPPATAGGGEEDGGGAEVVVPPLGIVEMGEVPLFLCSVICNTRMDSSLENILV